MKFYPLLIIWESLVKIPWFVFELRGSHFPLWKMRNTKRYISWTTHQIKTILRRYLSSYFLPIINLYVIPLFWVTWSKTKIYPKIFEIVFSITFDPLPRFELSLQNCKELNQTFHLISQSCKSDKKLSKSDKKLSYVIFL